MEKCLIVNDVCCELNCTCDSSCCDDNVATIKTFVKIISQKWALKIINVLNNHEYGFNELFNVLKTITRKVLTETLNNLIAKNIIEKETILKNNIVHSLYRLTNSGKELIIMLYQIKKFSCAYLSN